MIRLKLFSTALALACMVSAVPAQSVVNTNFASVNKVIPDGQASGVSDTHVLHFDESNFSNLTDLQVNITLSGGYNGDIYGYLVHDSGFTILFNRSGRASNGNGQLTGTWAPDGRLGDPASVTEATSPASLLGSFNGTDPNRSWTLFLADVDFGQQSTLVNWGLVISAVPEPASIGLVGVGALVAGASLIRRRK